MVGQVSVAPATAVAGYDIFRNETWRVSGSARILRGIRVGGSAAAGDCSFNLYVDQKHLGRFYNLVLGWPTVDHEVPLKRIYVPAGSTISAVMVTAPTTNPINVVLL